MSQPRWKRFILGLGVFILTIALVSSPGLAYASTQNPSNSTGTVQTKEWVMVSSPNAYLVDGKVTNNQVLKLSQGIELYGEKTNDGWWTVNWGSHQYYISNNYVHVLNEQSSPPVHKNYIKLNQGVQLSDKDGEIISVMNGVYVPVSKDGKGDEQVTIGNTQYVNDSKNLAISNQDNKISEPNTKSSTNKNSTKIDQLNKTVLVTTLASDKPVNLLDKKNGQPILQLSPGVHLYGSQTSDGWTKVTWGKEDYYILSNDVKETASNVNAPKIQHFLSYSSNTTLKATEEKGTIKLLHMIKLPAVADDNNQYIVKLGKEQYVVKKEPDPAKNSVNQKNENNRVSESNPDKLVALTKDGSFHKNDHYFKVIHKHVPVYNYGKTKILGYLVKDQIYYRKSGYGDNWNVVQFGHQQGYVWTKDTIAANGSSNVSSAKRKSSGRRLIVRKDAAVYDNSTGRLVKFATLSKGEKYPIFRDYGKWWEIKMAGRIGYLHKDNATEAFKKTDHYFRVVESDLPVYSKGKASIIGYLKKGQRYPRVSSFGDWHEIRFGGHNGFVWKGSTTPTAGQGLNQSDRQSYLNRKVIPLDNVNAYSKDEKSKIATLEKGQKYSVLGDYGKWWEIGIAGRIGYIYKRELMLAYQKNDHFFKVENPNLAVYDNSTGKLIQVGELRKGKIYYRESSYGPNWIQIKFGGKFRYVWRQSTEPVQDITKAKPKFYGNRTLDYFIPLKNMTVYRKGKKAKIATLSMGKPYPILNNYGPWYQIALAGEIGYVYKSNVVGADAADHINNNPNVEAANAYILGSLPRNYQQTANSIINKSFKINGPNGEVPLYNQNGGIDWARRGKSRSFLRLLHSLDYVNYLTAAYKNTGDTKYVQAAYNIIQDWNINNPYGASASPMAWHDETTARRMDVLLQFFSQAHSALSKNQLNNLYSVIVFHAELLASDGFYAGKNNHGMFQNVALLAFGNYFKSINQKAGFSNLAEQRMKNYFHFVISPEGVHLEQSPAYHYLVAKSINNYHDFFKSIGDSGFSSYLEDLYNKMAKYGTYVVKPDGTLPLLGDTFTGSKPLSGLWTNDPYYLYARTSGKEGKKPQDNNIVFPYAGYAIFRNGWTPASTYINFTAAYHSNYHKHSDDLSLLIYSKGNIITEAGPNGYDYSNPFTKYGYSSFAHNVLIVDGKGLPRVDGQYSKVYLSHSDLSNPNDPNVTGVEKRYQGVNQQRTVNYDTPNEIVTVDDKITSNDHHDYEFLWHLAEGITPVMEDNHTIELYKDGEKDPVMKIAISLKSATLSDTPLNIKIVNGKTDPYLSSKLGFVDGGGTPIYTIVVDSEASNQQIEKSLDIQTQFHILNQ